MSADKQPLASVMKVYEENRAKWTDEQLKPYLGQWVFFSLDGTRALASAVDLGEAYEQLRAAGIQPDDTVLDHLVVSDEIEIGLCETESA